jgi:cofilin
MSGIGVTEDAVNLYYLIRAKSTYKWALWQVDSKGTTVVIDQVGEPGSNFEEFLAALPENDCRYGIFDYQFTAPDGNIMNKLVFLNWAPDSARVKAKMMYASTKDFFKGHLDGISAEFQASDLDDVNEEIVAEAVKALKR